MVLKLPTQQSHIRVRRTVAAILGYVGLCLTADVGAQTQTWTGGGPDVNWITAANWGGVSWFGSSTTDVVFAGNTNTGTAGTPLNQNITNPLHINSLTFNSGGGAFFLGGFPLQFNGATNAITQNSSSAESIANDVSPNANSVVTLNLAGAGSGVVTISGAILNGAGNRDYAIDKAGTSSFVLSGVNTYAGGTTVDAGSLFINNSAGSGTGSAAVLVNNGGTLGGNGSISGPLFVVSGGNLAPGAFGSGTTAVFHTASVSLGSGSNFVLDLINTTAGTGYDQLSVTGTVNITGSNLVLNPAAGLSVNDKFFILANDGSDAVIGTFSQGTTITAANGDVFSINYADNFDGGATANDISLTLTGVVPEASTWFAAVVAFAIIGCDLIRRFLRRPL